MHNCGSCGPYPLGDPLISTPLSRDRRCDGFPQGGKNHSSPSYGWSAEGQREGEEIGSGLKGTWVNANG
eukprot:6306347-Pyramimonas_sp.AAC.1